MHTPDLITRPLLTGLVTGLLTLTGATTLKGATTVDWKGGDGNWEDAATWGGTLPP